METINVPIKKYNELMLAWKKLKELEKIDFDLIRQFSESLEDLRTRNFKVLA